MNDGYELGNRYEYGVINHLGMQTASENSMNQPDDGNDSAALQNTNYTYKARVVATVVGTDPRSGARYMRLQLFDFNFTDIGNVTGNAASGGWSGFGNS